MSVKWCFEKHEAQTVCLKSIQLATPSYPPLIPMLPAQTSVNPIFPRQGLVLALRGGAGAEY